MKIVSITERLQWETFMEQHGVTSFMQSWSWGEFEVSCSHEVLRFLVMDTSHITAAVQVIVIRSKRGTFLYVPHGPIFNCELIPWSTWTESNDSDLSNFGVIEKTLKTIHKELIRIARARNCSFIRLNSSLPKNTHLEVLFQEFGYKKAPIYLTSENAAVLPLHEQSSESLLANMRKTTRYLVNKAIKEEVTVETDTTGEKIQEFMQLYNVTTAREGFVGFGENYIKSEFEAFGKYGNAVILNANHKAQNLASALILFTKNAAFYHQGASNHPKVPAPYLLQWRAIQLAIERGCKYYNFWGTYIAGRTPKSWQGLSLFKLGFGTQIWNYLPTYDYSLSPSYLLTNLYEHYIRIKRRV